MTALGRFTIIAAAPLALAACGDSAADQPPPLPVETPTPAAQTAEPSAEAASPEEAPDETVVEVDPEIAGAEPMDAAAPMADANPMTDDFSMQEIPVE